jgi:hypothetical protein
MATLRVATSIGSEIAGNEYPQVARLQRAIVLYQLLSRSHVHDWRSSRGPYNPFDFPFSSQVIAETSTAQLAHNFVQVNKLNRPIDSPI